MSTRGGNGRQNTGRSRIGGLLGGGGAQKDISTREARRMLIPAASIAGEYNTLLRKAGGRAYAYDPSPESMKYTPHNLAGTPAMRSYANRRDTLAVRTDIMQRTQQLQDARREMAQSLKEFSTARAAKNVDGAESAANDFSQAAARAGFSVAALQYAIKHYGGDNADLRSQVRGWVQQGIAFNGGADILPGDPVGTNFVGF